MAKIMAQGKGNNEKDFSTIIRLRGKQEESVVKLTNKKGTIRRMIP